MSDSVSAPDGAFGTGAVSVSDSGLRGMITLRGDLGSAALADAVSAVAGVTVPAVRRIVTAGGRSVAWMSPDELLVLLPYADVPAAVAAMASTLQGEHALAVDVSDARAVFVIRGADADRILRRLSPADTDRMADREIRRTRIAQAACAFWRSGPGEVTLITFRSVAGYVFDLLTNAARG